MTEKPLEELRDAVGRKLDSGLNRSVEKLAPLLTLLPSSKDPLSSQIASLNELLSQSMPPLYKVYPGPALKLAASIFAEIFKSRISRLMKLDSQDSKKGLIVWEAVLRSILNGIQTYMNSGHADVVSLGDALYKPLFGILSSAFGLKLSARIRSQVYLLLSDAAEGCSENKALLRDKRVLGGTRLGGIIAATNEYLVMDALFQVLARLTPNAADAKGRASFAAEVFQNLKAKKVFGKEACETLARIFESAKARDWDKATEQILVEMAKTDLLRTQPFRLVTGKVLANSHVYLQGPPIDYLYVDSNNFVVNVQDEDAIDSLEIDYVSVTSIHITQPSEKLPNAVVCIRLSLSSPPMKGPEPVLPPDNNNQGNHFTFDIAAKDSDRFCMALQARTIGDLVQTQNAKCSKIKRSTGTLDLNHIDASSKSLAEKSQVVQRLYGNSSPTSRASEDRSTRTHNNPEPPQPADTVVFSEKEPPIEGLKTPPPPNSPELGEIIVSPKKRLEVGEQRSSTANKILPKTVPHTAKTAFFDDDESLTDLEVLGISLPKGKYDAEKSKVDSKAKVGDIFETPGPVAKPPRSKQTVQDISWAEPSKEEKSSKTRKRKRVVVSSDEEIENETRDQKPTYNSQLLLPCNTATTRSSVKYRARAKKAPDSASDFSDTSFGAIRPVLFSSPLSNVVRKISTHPGGEFKLVPENNVKKGTSAKTRNGRDEKNQPDHRPQESTVRRTQKILKNLKPSEVEGTKPRAIEIPPMASALENTPALINTSTKKKKEAPWKNLDHLTEDKDPRRSPSTPLTTSAAFCERTINSTIIPPLPTTRDSIYNADIDPMGTGTDDPKPLSSILAPPKGLEPLELDLAIAEAENLDMPVEFDTEVVVSTEHIPQPPLIADCLTGGKSDQEDIKPGMIETQVENVSKDDIEILDATHIEYNHLATQAPRMVVDPALSRSPQAPSQDIVMIDLTHVDESSQDEIENHHEDPPRSPYKSILKRQRVSFAHDTKPPSLAKKISPRIKTVQSKPIASKGLSTRVVTTSLIPRLAIKNSTSTFMGNNKAVDKTFIPFSAPQRLKNVRSIPHRTSTPFLEPESDEENSEMNPDGKILATLNMIQEEIVRKMNTKFDAPKMRAYAAREQIFVNTAEYLEGLLEESIHHCEKLVHLEADYAEHSRRVKRSLEDLNETNEETDRRLRQIILDHDRHSLSKKMPGTLVSTPLIFQRLSR